MKTVIIKSLLSIIAMLLFTPLCAQSLRSLSKNKRDSVLISVSKKVLEKKAPEYLLEYGKPVITKKVIHTTKKKLRKTLNMFLPLM